LTDKSKSGWQRNAIPNQRKQKTSLALNSIISKTRRNCFLTYNRTPITLMLQMFTEIFVHSDYPINISADNKADSSCLFSLTAYFI
jgi:hypothetical protein